MASHDPSSARNRRRRRPAWSTVALAALAPSVVSAAHPASLRKHARRPAPNIAKGKGRGRGDAAHVLVDAAHRPVVPMGSSQNSNPSGGNEKILAGAAEGAPMLYGAAQNNNSGSGSSNRGSMVVVQPENLRGSEALGAVDQQSQSQARGDVQLHPWPHPDAFQADEAGQPKAGTEYYYKNGKVVLEVQGAPAQSSAAGGSSAADGKRVDTSYHVAAYNYGQAQGKPHAAGGASKALPSPQEDWDAVAGKQVILRPRLSHEANAAEAPAKGAALPPMGSSKGGTGTKWGGEGEAPAVYYYDPRALQSAAAAAATAKTGDAEAAPELTLPEVVYDASGRAMKLEQVHAGGRNEVFLEVQPRAVWGADGLAAAAGAIPSQRGFASTSTSSGSSAASAGGRGQDQWIVLATVATMSLLVGALSARRLRNRRLLEGCLHPELDDECDDDLGGGSAIGRATPRYDKKFDADGAGGAGGEGAGFGALLGGRRGGGGGGQYGTTGDGLHWRGDAEKFDV